jgi:membrane associated rhomboid family serine protease/tetratricopeptide (TPR) repeat protein
MMEPEQPFPMAVATPPPMIRPPLRPPVVTLILLVLNLLFFLAMTLAGGSTNTQVLLDFGAASRPLFHQGEYWRLVMPMFLHIGFMHLFVNSLGLFFVGRLVEPVYGYARFALLYVVSGMGCAALSMAVSHGISAGASGAIMGIAGALVVTTYFHRELVPRLLRHPLATMILLLAVLADLTMGWLVPMIDNWGHLGGLATGILLALVMPPPGHDVAPGELAEEPSQAIVVIPILLVGLAAVGAADHYRVSRGVTRLLEQGERLRAAHQDDRARDMFQEAARRAPRDERPHNALGFLDLNQHRAAEAVEEFKQALRDDPESELAQLGLASAYQQNGDRAKAEQILEALLGKNLNNPEQQEMLGELCLEQKLYPEAIEHFQQALKLQPNAAISHNNLAWLYATSEDPKYRNPAGALEHARRAVQLSNGREPTFIDTLAEALYANGNFPEAVKVESRALDMDPRNAEYRDHMERYRKAAGAEGPPSAPPERPLPRSPGSVVT